MQHKQQEGVTSLPADQSALVAAAELLLGQVKATTFAEFQCQVVQVENCFGQVVMLLVLPETTPRLKQLLTRLVCCLASEFWLESQCFENFFTEQLQAMSAHGDSLKHILSEIIASVQVMVQQCENGSTIDEADSMNDKTGSQFADSGQ